MEYIEALDKILIANHDKIFIADPYTLKVENKYSLSLIEGMIMVENTNYVVITLTYNMLIIMDATLLKIIKVLDNTKYLTNPFIKQAPTKLFTLSTKEQVLFCSDEQGLYSWTISFSDLTSKYNGYVSDCNFY